MCTMTFIFQLYVGLLHILSTTTFVHRFVPCNHLELFPDTRVKEDSTDSKFRGLCFAYLVRGVQYFLTSLCPWLALHCKFSTQRMRILRKRCITSALDSLSWARKQGSWLNHPLFLQHLQRQSKVLLLQMQKLARSMTDPTTPCHHKGRETSICAV